MMFRYGKIIESTNKSSRSDRFAEMSKQQQLIESKKQEIKARFEERKRQDAVDTPKKTENKSSHENKSNKDFKTLTSSRMQSWKKDERWRKNQNNNELPELSSTNNLFSNDGSFLQQYKRISGTKLPDNNGACDVHRTLHTYEDQTSDIDLNEDNKHYNSSQNIDKSTMPHTSTNGIPYPPPNLNLLPATSSLATTSHQQSLYSLTAHPPPSVVCSSASIHTSLAAVPASVPVLSAVASSGTSLQTVSLIQVPVSVPASSVLLSCPLETTLVTSEPVVHLPVVHSTLSHGSISVPIQTVPLQTTVIPAQIQFTSQGAMPQTVQINQSSTNVILSQTLQPQSILVPSECIQQPAVSAALPNTNVPPPMLPAPPSQPPHMPPVFSQVTHPSTGVYTVQQTGTVITSTLPPVHIPPPNFNMMARRHHEHGMHGLPDPIINVKKSSCKTEEYDGYYHERSLTTSKSDNRQIPRSCSQREGGRDNSLEDMEAVAKVVADCGDEMENVLLLNCFDDGKFIFLRDKSSPPYFAFRNMVEKLRHEKKIGGSREPSEYDSRKDRSRAEIRWNSRIQAEEDESDSEEKEESRKRKRKRRSRWAPEDTKVEIPPMGVMPANSNIGIATPSALGTIVPVTPPTQTTKLPGISGPVISQLTKTDPALLQYAMQAFGTLNLSEEDWKKAEDHYKINLLYQDMLKKRQELERLQAAGKFKYAYDSDEDVEGGTWEHKLRNQEMVATQRWADELTERSKGKHHIGDFLPPDELERFMEKYDALKQGRQPDLSDYKEFKLKEDNIGFKMLQKLGWTEGQGLGSDGSGIVNPINKGSSHTVSHGLGMEKPDDVSLRDDEYDAYRKRMMLAYRFRPNPLNNPRRAYY